jgi:hypothetical protein
MDKRDSWDLNEYHHLTQAMNDYAPELNCYLDISSELGAVMRWDAALRELKEAEPLYFEPIAMYETPEYLAPTYVVIDDTIDYDSAESGDESVENDYGLADNDSDGDENDLGLAVGRRPTLAHSDCDPAEDDYGFVHNVADCDTEENDYGIAHNDADAAESDYGLANNDSDAEENDYECGVAHNGYASTDFITIINDDDDNTESANMRVNSCYEPADSTDGETSSGPTYCLASATRQSCEDEASVCSSPHHAHAHSDNHNMSFLRI